MEVPTEEDEPIDGALSGVESIEEPIGLADPDQGSIQGMTAEPPIRPG